MCACGPALPNDDKSLDTVREAIAKMYLLLNVKIATSRAPISPLAYFLTGLEKVNARMTVQRGSTGVSASAACTGTTHDPYDSWKHARRASIPMDNKATVSLYSSVQILGCKEPFSGGKS